MTTVAPGTRGSKHLERGRPTVLAEVERRVVLGPAVRTTQYLRYPVLYERGSGGNPLEDPRHILLMTQ